VPVKMQNDGNPHLPSDWAIEPRKLELGVIAAHTLFSDSHDELVACICIYSHKLYTLRANSFLRMAEMVVHVPGTSKGTVNSSLADSNNLTMSVQAGRSTGPESPDLRPQPVPDPTTELCSLTVSIAPTAEGTELGLPMSSSLEGLYGHV